MNPAEAPIRPGAVSTTAAPAIDLYLYRNDAAGTLDRARLLDDQGFDGLFVAETNSDPFQSLALAASETTRGVVGTSIALAFPRSPMLTAISAWDLQRETGGRFVLGLGSQVRRHIERRFSAPFSRPAARLRDYTLAVRACWAAFAGQAPLAHHGGYYTLDYLPEMMNPGPLPVPAPPIWLAALGPVMFRTAAEVADGALIHPVHTLEYLAKVAEPAIGEGLARAGRAREEFTLSATVLAIVAEAHDEAEREAVRAQLAFYASTPAYRPVLELHGWGALGDRLRDLVRRGEHPSMGSVVPDEVLETFCIVADTWEEAVSAARRRYAGVVDRVMFQAPVPATVTLPAP